MREKILIHPAMTQMNRLSSAVQNAIALKIHVYNDRRFCERCFQTLR